MVTVLHILNTSSFSGAENVAITIIEGFKAAHADIRSVYVSLDGSIRDVLDKRGIEFEPIVRLSRREIRRVIRKYRPDVIHAHDFTASIISALSTFRIPVISHIHNNSPWLKKVGKNSLVYGLSCLRYKKMLGVSPSVFDEFVFGRLFKRKSQVIGNPVSTASIVERAAMAEHREGYDVVFIGRLSEAKNPKLFVDVIDEIRKRCPVRAVMLGDGEMRGEIEAQIEEKGLGDVITLGGFVDNPYGILSESRLLLMTSSWEGYGLVAVEALSLGKPVVATRVGGIPTIVEKGSGFLCNTEDELVDSAVRLLTDSALYEVTSHAALERSHEIDNLDGYIENLNTIYRGMK